MKALIIALLCLAAPAFADDSGSTVLLYQIVRGEPTGHIGPAYQDKVSGTNAERSLMALLDILPHNQALCTASATPNGMVFVVGRNRSHVFDYIMYVDKNGERRMHPITDVGESEVAEAAVLIDATHIIWTTVPDSAVTAGLTQEQLAAQLADTEKMLKNLMENEHPGTPM